MSKSVNMERLIQNLDNKLENNSHNSFNNKTYLPLNENKNNIPDANFSFIDKTQPQPQPQVQLKLIKHPEVKIVKEKINYFSACKRYLLIFFIFIILSHQEFDYITNIDKMSNLYKIVLKAVVFVIILMILNIFIE